jgi:CBS domain-containing protein
MAKVTGTVRSILKHKGSEVWFVTPDQTVYEAIERMVDKAVGALFVISDGKLAGIISERDYDRGRQEDRALRRWRPYSKVEIADGSTPVKHHAYDLRCRVLLGEPDPGLGAGNCRFREA